MPALRRSCIYPNCGELLQKGNYCDVHKRTSEKGRQRHNYDVRKWYGSARWARLKARVRAEQPYCVECIRRGAPLADTTDIDHKVPHRGDPRLFWDRSNLQGLCHRCHSSKTRRGE